MTIANESAASRLLYKALYPRLVPANDSEYRELMALYRADAGFQSLVDRIAEGFRLRVLDFSDKGLLIVPDGKDSRFAMKMADLRQNLIEVDRAAFAIVLVAIAATFYPDPGSLQLDNDRIVTATANDILEMVTGLCRRFEEAQATDPESASPEFAEGWRYLLSKPSVHPTSDRLNASSVLGIITVILKQMTDNGLLHFEADSQGGFYTPTWRYQAQLRELAANQLFRHAYALAPRQPGTPQ